MIFSASAALRPRCSGEPPPLRGSRTGDDDDPVEVRFGLRFKEQRDIDNEPDAVCWALSRARVIQRGADRRVQDPSSWRRRRLVVENERAQSVPIWISLGVTNGIAESVNDLRRMAVSLVSNSWAFDRRRTAQREVTQQQAGERRLSGGDSAGDAEDGHSPILA